MHHASCIMHHIYVYVCYTSSNIRGIERWEVGNVPKKWPSPIDAPLVSFPFLVPIRQDRMTSRPRWRRKEHKKDRVKEDNHNATNHRTSNAIKESNFKTYIYVNIYSLTDRIIKHIIVRSTTNQTTTRRRRDHRLWCRYCAQASDRWWWWWSSLTD